MSAVETLGKIGTKKSLVPVKKFVDSKTQGIDPSLRAAALAKGSQDSLLAAQIELQTRVRERKPAFARVEKSNSNDRKNSDLLEQPTRSTTPKRDITSYFYNFSVYRVWNIRMVWTKIHPTLGRAQMISFNFPDNTQFSDASFFAFDAIVKNLEALGAGFTPPDEDLPYPQKIPILVKWLRENWKGCENLGLADPAKPQPSAEKAAAPITTTSLSLQKEESAPHPSAKWPVWATITGICVLLAAVIKWRKGFRKK